MTVVKEGQELEVFLDSLITVLEQNPETRVRRSPEDTSSVPYQALSDALLEKGLALTSATHAFIQYRFVREDTRVVETIEDLYFIYRENPEEEDLSILYVSMDHPVVRDVLVNSGIPSEVNMEAFTPFRRYLSFPRLAQQGTTTVVQMAGRPIRSNHERRQETLITYLDEFIATRGGGYELIPARQ